MPLPKITRRNATVLHELASGVGRGVAFPMDLMSDVLLLQVDGGAASAVSSLTLTANLSNGDLVTIGLQTYTARTALTSPAVPNEFLIGATADDTVDNLAAAINAANKVLTVLAEGTLYATGTLANFDVTAVNAGGDVLTITAREPGIGANAVVTTETSATASWTAGTMAGGTAFVATFDFEGSTKDHGGAMVAVEGIPLEGGAGVTSATTVGIWRLNVAGLLQFQAVLSAYTSGAPNVRVVHRGNTQG